MRATSGKSLYVASFYDNFYGGLFGFPYGNHVWISMDVLRTDIHTSIHGYSCMHIHVWISMDGYPRMDNHGGGPRKIP